MMDGLEIPEGWEGLEEQFIRHRLARELDASLLSERILYTQKRERMPADVRRRDDGGEE